MEDLLSQGDLLKLMHISRGTFWRMRKHENFPKPVILMGCQRWRPEDVQLWLEARKGVQVE
jgi:predicted DNA-binding transcriptional regulator AlpA